MDPLFFSVPAHILVTGTDGSKYILVKRGSRCVCQVASDRVKIFCRGKACYRAEAQAGEPPRWRQQEQQFLRAPETFKGCARSRNQVLCNDE